MKKSNDEYIFNEREFATIKAILFDVFCAYDNKVYGSKHNDYLKNLPDLNTWMGSETISNGRRMMWESDWLDYCTRHGVEYDELDEFDYEQRYYEEYDA